MARLIDRIMHSNLKDVISISDTFIVADNAADYFRERKEPAEYWKDLPCLTPPFRDCFIECKSTGFWMDEWGVKLVRLQIEEAKAFSHLFREKNSHLAGAVSIMIDQAIDDFPNTEWLVIAIFIGEIKHLIQQFAWMVIPLDEFGVYQKEPHRNNVLFTGAVADMLARQNEQFNPASHKIIISEDRDSPRELVYPLLNAPLFALSLLNTRNTVLIDNPPPVKLSKRHEKKYGVPLVTYKTLKVLPMRKVNQNDYDADNTDTAIPKSLHIARGHFKDYRNGPGLFGKYQDIFWWDAHVRGSAEHGVTVKDYEIIAPVMEGQGN